MDSVDLLPRFVFESVIEFNIALPATSPGAALVSSVALAVFASSILTDGARSGSLRLRAYQAQIELLCGLP